MANEISLEQLIKFCNQQGLNLTSRRYRQLAKEDKAPEPQAGKVDAIKALAMIAVYYQKLAAGNGSLSLTDERTRLTKINADRKELQLKKEQGELIHVDIAMKLWGHVISVMKTKLSAIPTKMAPLVSATVSISEAKEIIEKSIEEIQTELATPKLYENTRMAGNKSNNKDVRATTKTKRKPVGGRKKSAKP